MKRLIPFCLLLALFYSCSNNPKENKETVGTVPRIPEKVIPSKGGFTEQDSIKATGRQILVFLKAGNFQELIKYFSPEGVRFSPYGFIDTLHSKKLTPEDFLESVNKNWVLTWGSADGTGDPIKLTVKAYLKKFVYNADFLNAEAIGYDEILKKGNSFVNLKEIYPNQHFIDYHFSGFDQKFKGMDWLSLKLVFQKQDGQYFLVAIIHDQWTI